MVAVQFEDGINGDFFFSIFLNILRNFGEDKNLVVVTICFVFGE
jgi:hypothetical protein